MTCSIDIETIFLRKKIKVFPKKTMNMMWSPDSKTVFRIKKMWSLSYKIIEYDMVNRY